MKLIRWAGWIVAGLAILWIAVRMLSPGPGQPDTGTAALPAAASPPVNPPAVAPEPPARGAEPDLPPWQRAAPATTPAAPATAPAAGPEPAMDPANVPGATAVRDELLRIGASSGLDVGAADAPLAGWLASGTPQQQENRMRLTRLLMRCAREIQWDGSDPAALPALRACEDRGIAQGGQQ